MARTTDGLFRPVDYTDRTRYRRPPGLYRRLQWLGPLVTRWGLSPDYVITLQVPGRRTGAIHRTTLVQVEHDGERFLVALAGESEWVRNVRAAGGRAMIGRRRLHTATLVEVPAKDRAGIIHAYVSRPGRHGVPKIRAGEARSYFGISTGASLDEIRPIVEHYPVFRVVLDPPAP